MEFSKKICRGYILRGDLIGAINYVKRFPEQAELYNRWMDFLSFGEIGTGGWTDGTGSSIA